MNFAKLTARAGLVVGTAALGMGALFAPAAGAASPPDSIGKGDSGHGVWCVQRAVNNYYKSYYGKNTGVISEDGQFGTSTADWVSWYQARHGLPTDSIVGHQSGYYVLIDDGWYRNYCKSYVPH